MSSDFKINGENIFQILWWILWSDFDRGRNKKESGDFKGFHCGSGEIGFWEIIPPGRGLLSWPTNNKDEEFQIQIDSKVTIKKPLLDNLKLNILPQKSGN